LLARIRLLSLTFEYTHVILLLPRIGGRGLELASRAAFPRGFGSRQAGGCGGTGRAGGTTTCLRGRPKPQAGGRVRRPGPDVAPSGTMSAEPGDRGRIPARCGASRSTAFADRRRRAVTRFNTLSLPAPAGDAELPSIRDTPPDCRTGKRHPSPARSKACQRAPVRLRARQRKARFNRTGAGAKRSADRSGRRGGDGGGSSPGE
jgi:hypothetical protein